MFSKQFICAGEALCDYAHPVAAPLFRRSFTMDAPPQEAELTLCGLGFYELFVNGQRITRGALAPYLSAPDDLLYYDRYDLLSYLHEGENVIGVMLGNGLMNPFDGYVWEMDKAPWRGSPRLAMEVCWRCGDREERFEADERFRTAPGPVTFDALRVGAFYDARLEKPGWDCPGYDDGDWRPAQRTASPGGEACFSAAEPVEVYRELRPVSITHEDDFCYCTVDSRVSSPPEESTRVRDTYVYDFGENNAGVCRLKIRGERGQTVTLRYGEMLLDGHFSLRTTIFNRPNTKGYLQYPQMDRYTLRGGEEEIFVPPFTYHGFRYVLVEGITREQATPELLTYEVISSRMEERGSFACSDETLNTLFQMAQRSDRANLVFIPTDCPHREKNGWTADAALSAEHMLLTLTAENTLREWLRGVRKAQRSDGALPGIIPTGGWGFEWGNGPAWDCVCVWMPYALYRFTGDRSVILENLPMIDRYLTYIAGRRDERGLVAIGLGDWVQPRSVVKETLAPLIYTDSLMVLDIANKARQLAGIVGDTALQQQADELAQSMRRAIRTHLMGPDAACMAVLCQTTQAMALATGVFEPTEIPEAVERLVALIHENDEHFLCGVLGGRVLFRVLAEHGYMELALRMITAPGYPSYANWIEQGETTLCESFHLTGEATDSRNHHFWGDIAALFIEKLAGLCPNPELTDICRVDVTPQFPMSVAHARAAFRSIRGVVAVSWQREADLVRVSLTVPEGIHGSVRLPGGWHWMQGGTEMPLCAGEWIAEKE